MSPTQFLTIAGRWKQHTEVSGLNKALPRREQALAMMMFYAGFSAALEATVELADFEEEDAMRLLSALHAEKDQVTSLAERLLGSASTN